MMDKNKIIEITNDVQNKSNKDLFVVIDELGIEFENRAHHIPIEANDHTNLPAIFAVVLPL